MEERVLQTQYTEQFFPVYNLNQPPEITQCTTSTPVIDGDVGVIEISVCGSDYESDSINLYLEYSLDSINYTAISRANIVGQLSELRSNFSTSLNGLVARMYKFLLAQSISELEALIAKNMGHG